MKVPKKSRLSSSAATIAGNGDLLTEILVLLPVKTLFKLKSVSTHWQSLISSESFARLHLLNHGRRPPETLSFILGVRGRSQLLICHPAVKRLARFPLPLPLAFNFFRHYENMKIVQSCNGLLLIKTKRQDAGQTSYWVVNPSTVQSRCISTPQFQPIAVCLLFDPSKSLHYRVVAFWKDNLVSIYRFSVYDSATHDWKDGGEFPCVVKSLADGLRCNNRAYFSRPGSLPLLCYSPNEELRNVPCPPQRIGKRCMMESNEHLHCIYRSSNGNRHYFHIAEMIDDTWLTYTTGVINIANSTNLELLGMMRKERMEDSSFLFHVPGRIMIYRFGKARGCEVVVDYRSDFFYEEGHLQFEFKDASV